jgi:hypothetical protein
MTLAEKIVRELDRVRGLSDRQLSEVIFGTRHRSTQINGECRYMECRGVIERKKQGFGPILNYLARPRPNLRLI